MAHPLDSLFLMNIPFFANLDSEQVKLLIIFGFVIVLVAIRSVARIQRQKMWHDTVRAAIDKGQPIPDALAKMPAWSRGRCCGPWMWYRGLIWIAVGIGLYLVNSGGVRQWAPLPICVGAALLIGGVVSSLVGNRHRDPQNPSSGQ